MYTEKELVGIARRENNNKRTYLVVNKYQGKHVPASPKKILDMFQDLAGIVKKHYMSERLLLVGFAETATAIGAAVAATIDCDYIQTTREIVAGAECLYFSEVHSHATEQKLVKNELDRIISSIDRIVFVEDEVTTGNTIMNIINIIEKEYRSNVSFAVASLLNGMDREAEDRYLDGGIDVHYLLKTNHASYALGVSGYKGNGTSFGPFIQKQNDNYRREDINGCVNARRATKSDIYQKACMMLWDEVNQQFDFRNGGEILVLGTEEFMYPALLVAREIEKAGCKVKFHATTRSPIMVSEESDYPLHTRYELKSLYDRDRITYIYELAEYDSVYVITDANEEYRHGFESLAAALELSGNKNINLIRWCQ